MEISEQELRAMIRDAIHRSAGAAPIVSHPDALVLAPQGSLSTHASHGMLAVVATGDGECIIEPSVRCNHCGYCKSMGH
jgi:hypothetical protein